MSLDSTDFQTNATDGKQMIEVNAQFDSKKEVLPNPKQVSNWSYLFAHRTKVNVIDNRLQTRFRTFIHKSIVYKRADKGVCKDERPTISGLLFVQGDVAEIQNFLKENFIGLYLAKDYSTGKPAVISDSVMQPFMQMALIEPTRIRFLPHEYGYYSSGNTPVCITSGILEGFVGYRIRINRDRCFILSMGGMAVAINGIHKDSFENLEDYALNRKKLLQPVGEDAQSPRYSAKAAELAEYIFVPESQLDVMAIAKILLTWESTAEGLAKAGKRDEAADMALAAIEVAGYNLRPVYAESVIGIDNLYEIDIVCRAFGRLLMSIINDEAITLQMRLHVLSRLKQLHELFPFLQVGDIPKSVKG